MENSSVNFDGVKWNDLADNIVLARTALGRTQGEVAIAATLQESLITEFEVAPLYHPLFYPNLEKLQIGLGNIKSLLLLRSHEEWLEKGPLRSELGKFLKEQEASGKMKDFKAKWNNPKLEDRWELAKDLRDVLIETGLSLDYLVEAVCYYGATHIEKRRIANET